MPSLATIISFVIHFDKYFLAVTNYVGVWSYVLLFLVIFAETGLVIAPFLPGDSLLFVAGTLSGAGHLNILSTYLVLLLAAIVGDTVNYWVGHYVGPKVFDKPNSRLFKKEYLEKTREFYDQHGGKTIILARFLPILRTFAPFVAGIGKMHYSTFIRYNIIGATLWVSLFIFSGYFFGSLPLVKENFHYTVLVIIVISLLPLVIEYVKYRRGPRLSPDQMRHTTYEEIVETVEQKN